MDRRLAIGLVAGALGISAAVLAAERDAGAARVARLLKARLPRTEVSSIDCRKLAGLCEVTAGKSLFYTDHSARFLFVGRVYDMQLRQDLTASRLLELNPALLLGNAARLGGAEGGADERPDTASLPPAGEAARQDAVPAVIRRVDLSGLPAGGAIEWGRAGGTPVTIFTDFRCGYCRALAAQLEQMNVRVSERPISILGSRDIANRVLCARDRPRAIKAAYNGETLPPATCDTSALDANETFARDHGFSGTPVLVRKDGAVLEGFRPRDVLETWLRGAR